MKCKLILILLSILVISDLCATHNRAGEIRFTQIRELTIRAELITYTKASSISADRDSITFSWGDGTFSTISRDNGTGLILPNDIKMNIYIMEHEYPGRGDYVLSILDPNRVENILNVDPPNSVNIPFYIQTTIKLFNSNFQGLNTSPILSNPPIDFACVNQLFIHNPGAIDLDDDSLAYELIVPMMDQNMNVPNYLYPNQIRPGFNNNIYLDPKTGTFTWNFPQLAGEYNIAILIKEYRKGQLISATIRDMQILVIQDCEKNNPPTISGRRDTCIVAGQTFKTNFIIDDIDRSARGGKVKTQVFGSPFLIQPTATSNATGLFESTPYSLNLEWNTSCKHVRNDPYDVIIKATDNYYDTSGLSNTFIYQIKVLGPAPENLESSSDNKNIYLQWDNPYFCDDNLNNFRGFSVWRKELPGVILDSCKPGLQNYGYTQVAYLVKNTLGSKYLYTDTTAIKNKNYCYRIQAEFALISPSGFLYNFTPSLPSNETCITLRSKEPFLLHVDVRETNLSTGRIFVDYHRPILPDFDTTLIPGPYEVKLFHAESNSAFSVIPQFTRIFPTYSLIVDTSFIHDNINSAQSSHTYKVQYQSIKTSEAIESEPALSTYLNCLNKNKGISLSWTNKVPWINEHFIIFRKLSSSSGFDSIASTFKTEYVDRNITFDSVYCYVIKSVGQYTNPSIIRPLINFSNESCIQAVDSTPPCCPDLLALGPCDLNDSSKVILRWSYREDSCSSLDITSFSAYEINGDVIKFITDLPSAQREYEINNPESLGYCYVIEAKNLKGLSCSTSITCTSYCPEIELPNTFTPNNDGSNDIFIPRKFRQILYVKFIIVNQWGNRVYNSEGNNIRWDGKNSEGVLCTDGTYFYTCEYQTAREKKTISGFIELLSSQ
ncbi:MAG: T9SS type B sorting domain-containing protein [Saprospiraceae bacterium]|nr:T9SS type B sorting domain-containing protein [Saprospiraceae bacterium]